MLRFVYASLSFIYYNVCYIFYCLLFGLHYLLVSNSFAFVVQLVMFTQSSNRAELKLHFHSFYD